MRDWCGWFDKYKLDVIVRLRCEAAADDKIAALLQEAAGEIERLRTECADAEGRWAATNSSLYFAEKRFDNLVRTNEALQREISCQKKEISYLKNNKEAVINCDFSGDLS